MSMVVNTADAYTMLGSYDIWETARRCHEVLTSVGLPYALVGGVAVCLHGYRRNTIDVDILIRREDSAAVRQALEANGLPWDDDHREFRGPNQIPVHIVLGRTPAGNDRTYNVDFPDPAEAAHCEMIDGLSVVTLARLIEVKLTCGLGSLRRAHRDFADVVELILIHNLDGRFAGNLHKSVRREFRRLVAAAREERQ
jgi:hypothetical protein